MYFVCIGPNEALPGSCDYFQVSCDQQLRFCLLYCIGPSVPYSLLVQYDKDERKLQAKDILEDNSELRDSVSDIILPTLQNFTVPSDEGS